MARGFVWKDKIAAGFTNSGAHAGDKLATLIQIALFAAQHGMHWVNLALPAANNSTTGSEEELNRLGFWLGAGAQSNVDQGPDAAPPEADLAPARHLGQRVAEASLQFVRGPRSLVLNAHSVHAWRDVERRRIAQPSSRASVKGDADPGDHLQRGLPVAPVRRTRRRLLRVDWAQGRAPTALAPSAGRWLDALRGTVRDLVPDARAARGFR